MRENSIELFGCSHEIQMDAGNRPGTWQRLRVGAKRDGALTAISLVSYGTAGIGLGAGVGNNAETLYTCPNFEGAQRPAALALNRPLGAETPLLAAHRARIDAVA